MKVRYSTERGYEGQGADPDFTLGKTYLVFGISFRPEGRPTYVTIRCDSDGTPVLLELCYFDIVDGAIPPGWCFFDYGDGYHALRPKEFGGDFWDLYNDADPAAEAVFEQVEKKLIAFHAE